MTVTEIYESIFIIIYLLSISLISILLDKNRESNNINTNADSTWYLFYAVSVLIISMPIAVIITSIFTAIIMNLL